MHQSIHFKSVILLSAAITLSSVALAQETKPENRSVEIAILSGFGNSYSVGLSNDTWSKHTPGFVIPTDSLGYQQNSDLFYAIGERASFLPVNSYVLGSVHVSYRNAFLDAKKIRSSAGIVFGSGIGYQSSQSWTKNEVFTIDTLTSSQTGQQYPVDSTHNQTIGRSYSANEFMVGVSHFFQTDPSRRFSLYLGINASYGFSVNSRVYTYESNWSSVDPNIGSGNSYENKFELVELSDAPKAHSLALQVPVELSYRPWKNGKALQGLSVALSFRPTFKHFVIADKKENMISSWGGFTLRLTI